jgi:hypothetical protein
LNWLCGIVFGLGVLLLVAFVIVNIQHEANMNSKVFTTEMKGGQGMKIPNPGEVIQKGQTMKSPPPPPSPSPSPANQSSMSNNSGAKK